MKEQEFRIGNLFNQFGNVHRVTWCTLKDIENAPEEQLWCKPIPLTEEWLMNFGFKQWGDKYTFGLKGINIHHRKRGFVLRKSIPIIRYVHQLQNLYFALTGEELTIK